MDQERGDTALTGLGRPRGVSDSAGDLVDSRFSRVMGSLRQTEAWRGSRCESGAVPPLSPGSTPDERSRRPATGPLEGPGVRQPPGSQETLTFASSIQGADPE
ncbi:hypothetical protein GCM10010442_40540 [Kitasatospora kifunensis]